jgi:hydrogenase nickel incorporation protein HypA/HybF
MHELSLAQGIFNKCMAEMKNHHFARVKKVTVKIGEMMSVEPRPLQTFFDDMVVDTPLQNARLIVNEIPIECECENCGGIFQVSHFVFQCPRCHHTEYKMLHGGEFEITKIEGEEEESSLAGKKK